MSQFGTLQWMLDLPYGDLYGYPPHAQYSELMP
jgi:hypothetical protein